MRPLARARARRARRRAQDAPFHAPATHAPVVKSALLARVREASTEKPPSHTHESVAP